MTYENLITEKRGHVSIVTVDHPPVNAWNLATMEEFEKIITKLENEKETRVVVLTGAGEKCFSAGFDITDAANAGKISPKGRALWKKVDCLSKPVIAAMNGSALGGGLELALACHFRIMTDDPAATLGLTELNLGIIPGWGGTQRLSRVIGRTKALKLILLSETITAQEALKIGLVDQLSKPETLLDDALALAERLAERPPVAVRWVLKAIAAGEYEGIDAGLRVEAEGAAVVRESRDREEGFAAFREKRRPVFRGE
ncbi:MAG: enoyl-CoA hydratase-related protein [Deltaproteobacteria bacterium]